MENNSNKFATLFKRLEDFAESNIELLKYKAIDKITDGVSSMISGSLIVLVFLVFILFLSAGAALWLGEIYGKIYYGVFIVSGIYGVIGICLYLLRNKIKQNINDTIISKTFNQ